MDWAHYEESERLLHGLLVRLDDRLADEDITMVVALIDANELGLALEQLAYALSEEEQPLSSDERADILALANRMQMDGQVPRALESCPAR